MVEKPKIILTDCDGCLINWIDHFDEFMAAIGYEMLPGTDSHYSITLRYGISDIDAMSVISHYNKSKFISDLSSYADSQIYVRKLSEKGFRFVAITSIGDDPVTKIFREKNLKNLFGDIFQEVICLPIGSAKDHVLKMWEGSDLFWIEDHIENAEDGHQLGLKSILVPHNHNEHYSTDHFTIVDADTPWQDIYRLVCKDYNIPA